MAVATVFDFTGLAFNRSATLAAKITYILLKNRSS